MSERKVLAISASPSEISKTVRLVEAVLGDLRARDIDTEHVALRDLDPGALLAADVRAPSLAAFRDKVVAAHGLIIATPIYKASFSGLLKAGLDALPQFALAGKVVLPLATGGSLAHVLALDYALRPVFQSMGARHVVQSHFAGESDFPGGGEHIALGDPSWAGLRFACDNFVYSLTDDHRASMLGHPRPPNEVK
ncbi:NADPH-dependent FMN reductase [Methylovirgula sp. 4M-Z18]|uniref:NADPH-dependent FMN reductase n=1 Tax=Methylovirgula sp. 4M-Z18 TaxID=2293567 RepID=UPI000E2EBAF4|nr:NADPH-dependent FMN reductase [Methylovirgula sp. 4M-Z18]RFB80511.1 FMN reductase (NADPH) [Methylovirgula sp. 4M-Z18]